MPVKLVVQSMLQESKVEVCCVDRPRSPSLGVNSVVNLIDCITSISSRDIA